MAYTIQMVVKYLLSVLWSALPQNMMTGAVEMCLLTLSAAFMKSSVMVDLITR